MELSQILITVFYALMISSLLFTFGSVIYYKKQKIRLQGEFFKRMEISELEENKLILIPQDTDNVRLLKTTLHQGRSNKIKLSFRKHYGDIWIPEFRVDSD